METEIELEDGLEALRTLEEAGGRFVAVEPGGKRPVGMKWQDKPRTLESLRPHLSRGGNVGLLAGTHSGGLCVLDLDAGFPEFLQRFPQFAEAPRVTRADAPERGKILVKITGEVPAAKKWKPEPARPPLAEFLSDRNQAVMPPSVHPRGARFEAHCFDRPIPEMSAAQFDEAVWFPLTGTHLARGSARMEHLVWVIESPKAEPSSRAGGARAERRVLFSSLKEMRDAIARRLDMVSYACHALDTTAEQVGDEWRVAGQGGMLINPALGRWNTFEGGTGEAGGDCFDLISYINFGVVRPTGQMWRDTVRLGGEYLGFSLSKEGGRRGHILTGSEVFRQAGSLKLAWGPWMVAGVPTIIGGMFGVGKTPLLLWIVACYLRGAWPDGTPVPDWFAGRDVVYYVPEGNATQLALLEQWGLDEEALNRFHVPGFSEPQVSPKTDFEFSLDAEGLALLREACEKHDPALIVVDGLRAAMEGDESRSADSKAFFAPLTKLAHQHGAALIVSHHLKKGIEFLIRSGELPSIDWYRGSGDLLRPVRSAWILDQPNPYDQNARCITLVKASEGPRQITMAYRMGAPSEGLVFGGEVPMAPPATKKEEAERFLLSALKGGQQRWNELVPLAQEAGINEHTLRKARDVLSAAFRIELVATGQTERAWRLVAPDGEEQMSF